jgi:hypothetical protein
MNLAVAMDDAVAAVDAPIAAVEAPSAAAIAVAASAEESTVTTFMSVLSSAVTNPRFAQMPVAAFLVALQTDLASQLVEPDDSAVLLSFAAVAAVADEADVPSVPIPGAPLVAPPADLLPADQLPPVPPQIDEPMDPASSQ